MTSLRLVLGGAAAAALVGFTAGFLNGDGELAPPPAPAVATSPAALAPKAEPLPPAVVPDAARPRVPAAILARAADARALDRRGEACPPAGPTSPAAHTSPSPPREEPPRCAPEQRETIEIDWHVTPRNP
jgi:hypothetical protein